MSHERDPARTRQTSGPAADVNQSPESYQPPARPAYRFEAALVRECCPAELIERPQWICWQYELRDGKWSKVPKRADRRANASSTNSATWGTFEAACAAAEQLGYAGVGYVFAENDPFVGIDIDDCFAAATGAIAPWAATLLDDVNTYTERSPSGVGAKAIARADVPVIGGGEIHYLAETPDANVAVYSKERYFTVTGERIDDYSYGIEDRGEILQRWDVEVFGKGVKARTAAHATAATKATKATEGDHETIASCVASMLRMKMTDSADGSKRLFAYCCRAVEFDLGDVDAIRAVREASSSRPFPRDWSNGEIVKRLRQAERQVTRGKSSTTASDGDDTPIDVDAVRWPDPLDAAALHGLAGDAVRLIEPKTEADPYAVLIQFLAAFGNAVGRSAYLTADGSRHFGNLYVVLVGDTSKGRKGTSWRHVKNLFDRAAPTWAESCVVDGGGLSSGEGLLWTVRDAVIGRERAGRGNDISFVEVEIDPGVADKRLLVQEGEFANVLKVMARETNTLSPVLRQGWDTGTLRSMVKNNPARATGAHISIVGHITSTELQRLLDATEAANGFGNRFLWVCVRRSKVLPFGGAPDDGAMSDLAERLSAAIASATEATFTPMDPEARQLWADEYPALSASRAGMVGAMLGRAEAQSLRLAMLYALLDGDTYIRPAHLRAGLAIVAYVERSIAYIFGHATGSKDADDIEAELRRRPSRGLDRTAIRDLFGRHGGVARIEKALALLLRLGRIVQTIEPTAGRSRCVYYLAGHAPAADDGNADDEPSVA